MGTTDIAPRNLEKVELRDKVTHRTGPRGPGCFLRKQGRDRGNRDLALSISIPKAPTYCPSSSGVSNFPSPQAEPLSPCRPVFLSLYSINLQTAVPGRA